MTQFFSIVTGLLLIILGIILIAMPGVLSTILAIVLGLWIILSSVNVISISIAVRKKNSSWFLLLKHGLDVSRQSLKWPH